METGRPQVAAEQHVLRPDGQAAWLMVTRLPWRGLDGALLGTFGVVRDITARKRVEAELQAQRDFALQVMNAMGQGLTITDADGRFEYVNSAYARMLGYSAEALIGQTPQAVTFAEDHLTLEQARRWKRDVRPHHRCAALARLAGRRFHRRDYRPHRTATSRRGPAAQ
jgi:PAS domain S-box-containing protein